MALPLIFAPVLTFLLREVIVKFVVFAAVFALVAFFVPYAVSLLTPHIGTAGLTGRFLIRRLPVIG